MADKIKKIKIGTTAYDIVDASVPGQITAAVQALDSSATVASESSGVITITKTVTETDGKIGNGTGSTTTNTVTEIDNKDAATLSIAKKYTDVEVAKVTGGMVFKGSVGTSGTIAWTALPTAADANKGYTYKVITDHSSDPACKVGDMIISNGTEWVVIPSGDEPSGTVTSVATGTGLTGGTITSSGTISIDRTTVDTWYDAKNAASNAVAALDVASADNVTTSDNVITLYNVNETDGKVGHVVTAVDTTWNATKIAAADEETLAAAKKYHDDNQYVHPTHTAYANGLYKVTVDNKGHVTAATAVAKADITGLGIPGSDTNTAHGHSAGVGLVGSGNAGTSGTYTYKAALANETLDTNAAVSRPAANADRTYPVIADKNGKLATIVPWTDTDNLQAAKEYADGEDAKLKTVAVADHTHAAGSLAGSCTPLLDVTKKRITASASGTAVTMSDTQFLISLGTPTTQYLVTNSIAANGMVTGLSSNKDIYNASYDATNECLDLTTVTLTVTKNSKAITYATGASTQTTNTNASFISALGTPGKAAASVASVTQPTIALADTATTGGVEVVTTASGKSTSVTITGATGSGGGHSHTVNKTDTAS